MRILVRHAAPPRRWHQRLGERLEAAGHQVAFEGVRVSFGRWLGAAERRLHRIEADWDAIVPLPRGTTSRPAMETELTIVLAGALPGHGCAILVEIAGRFGEDGIAAAARGGVAPLIRILESRSGAHRVLAAGRPAIEDPQVSVRARENLLPRLVTLLAQAVEALSCGATAPSLADDPVRRPPPPAAFFARGLAAKIGRRLGPARGRPDHWRIALRGPAESDWRPMPHEASRFQADPFPFEEAGRLWLFTEEFAYATGKGVIAVRQVAESDPASGETPRVVLDEPFHLSYPVVLRHGGEIYMLPEAAQSGRLRLYRAAPFPERWMPDAVLLDERLGDATPVYHQDRWWLFATAVGAGSSWDELHLFQAPDLLGPWTPHRANPVLIDAGAARPAGMMWHEDGALMRPAQDCRTGYGAGVAICRVDRLDETGYAQSVVRRVAPPAGATGVHTLNRLGPWDIADLKVPHPALR